MNTQPAGQKKRVQSDWLKKQNESEYVRMAGNDGSRQRRNVTAETKDKKETTKHMKQTEIIANDLGTLADDARASMTATADVAGEKMSEARKRLADALANAKEIAGRARDKAVDCAKATDQALHKHPYEAIGIALGAGLILGYLILGRKSHNGN